ncbi:DnaD domain protein [Lysinibacillus fusiformis]|nr:DnaD domain protein [Lysinibacillus fusiformis]
MKNASYGISHFTNRLEGDVTTMNLLIKESPLQVLPSLAVKIGLNQALVLQQMYYWLRISKNYRDGHKWIYKTLEDWHKEFPFWSKSTLERTIRKLEEQQLIVVGHYNRMKMDRTKWYRFNQEAIADLCTAHCTQHDGMQVSEMTESTTATCALSSQQIDKHVDRNLTSPVPLDYTESTTETTSSDSQQDKKTVPTAEQFYVNNGFGRLNPYIAQKIVFWKNESNEDLVIFAMKTAIDNNVSKWSYVESVLRDWQQKQLQTVADAAIYKQSFHTKQAQLPQKRTEIIPHWFQKRHIGHTAVPIDFEAERKKILKKLNRQTENIRNKSGTYCIPSRANDNN